MNKIFDSRPIKYIRTHKRNSLIALTLVLVLLFIFRPKATKVVQTEPVKRGEVIQSISATGTIAADKSVDLSFLTGGRLVYLGAKRGDEVQAGQLIASLDQQSIQKNLESSLIDYAKQRNTFDTTQQQNGNRNPAQALNDQMKQVLENNQNDLNKAIVSVQLQELARQNSVLVSPISGILTRADVSQAGVNIGPTSIFTVADPNSMVLKIDVDEADIGKVVLNQVANVNLDAYPDETLHLSVTSIDFASHATTTGGTAYTVEAQLPNNSDYRYRIGMTGNAEIVTAEKRNVLTIPVSALFNNNYVYVKNKKTYEKRQVTLGMTNDTTAEIKSGLTEGEMIATQPNEVPVQK